MRNITLTEHEHETLDQAWQNHPKLHVRYKSKALLLSNKGFKVKEIAHIFDVRTRTIYTWMDRWLDMGYIGLTILPGRGVKPTLSLTDEKVIEVIKKHTITYSRSLIKIAKHVSESLNLIVSPDMMRRCLKYLGYTWKRFRKSLKKKQSTEEYEQKLSEIKTLLELQASGYLDLYFGDESGFNMEGYVPYGWQPKREYIHITPEKSKTTQIFGIMNLNNQLDAYTFNGCADSEMIIACIDDFCKRLSKRTVIVLDNAPIHHSIIFQEKIKEWQKQDLYIFFLPTYSPHLNPIEILWRMMKYSWIEYENIDSQSELNQAINDIIEGFGTKYTINFKEHEKKVSNIFT